MAAKRDARRPRRKFTPEFKADAVRLVLIEGKGIGEVARELDLTESALRQWVDRAKADSGAGRSGMLTTGEREELSALRKRGVSRLPESDFPELGADACPGG
ncbi:MAG: transposase [Myxococcaceae bacterium]